MAAEEWLRRPFLSSWPLRRGALASVIDAPAAGGYLLHMPARTPRPPVSTTPDPAALAQLARHAFDGTLFTVAGQPVSAWALVKLAPVLLLAVWLGGYLHCLLLRLSGQRGSFNRGSVLTVARLLRSRIRTPDGTVILVPNSVLVEGSVRNLSALDTAHRLRFEKAC